MSRNGRRPATQNSTAPQGMQNKESLLHNPHRLYRMLAATPPPGDYIQLTPVEHVHGRKRIDLSISDPSPANVKYLREVAAKKRNSLRLTTLQTAAADVTTSDLFDDFFDEEADTKRDSIFLTQLEEKARVPEKPVRKQLPQVVLNHPGYSSTMALLQLTRPEVEQHAREISAISSILTIPGSIELKRTIARMFADPKHAEEISKAELERKAKKYEEERSRQAQRQAEQLRKQQELLRQELENYRR